MSKTAAAPGLVVDRNLALELVRVTEAAALAASRWIGRGDKNAADGAAVEAMRKAFDTVAITGTVVIGEGEMDEAPMLYIGEKVGLYAKTGGGPEVDIAVDPLEGTSITARLWRWRKRAVFCMRRIFTWTSSRLGLACRKALWIWMLSLRRICANWRAPRNARLVI